MRLSVNASGFVGVDGANGRLIKLQHLNAQLTAYAGNISTSPLLIDILQPEGASAFRRFTRTGGQDCG